MSQALVPYISEGKIRARVKELAASISEQYRGKELVLIGVLKGAVLFMADIMRQLDVDFECDFVRLSSYGGATDSSGRVHILSEPSCSLSNKNVLMIDCVVDTGLTLEFLMNYLRGEKPLDMRSCVLLSKEARRSRSLSLDYVGFTVTENLFLLGYGLDHAEKYRGLPYIAYLKEE